MAKLANLKPALSSMAPRLNVAGPANERERSSLRSKTEPAFRWYNTARWRKLRMEVITRDRFTCRMCKRIEPNTANLVADHVIPHRNDPVKFWEGKLQTLCRTCHSTTKQKAESSMPKGVWY
ncbi:HNH endonuclease [Mesorhizobium caraganae]|uniref:HNH endonuclease n=1 Tax=Mesorhizobium caraganae TaxID=483206 RepID=UPI00193A939F|nr:HNH endonuclease [Mesorhizobium caraganae]MBM2711666.1 HNH endonuclease [Mesorhizobium caraganae]